MRPMFPLLVFTASFGMCQAQSPYRPFPEANAAWVETHSFHVFGGPFGDEISSCHRTIESGGDSLINDTTYRELLIRGICDPFDDPYPEAEHSFCWFRQDIGERKVYVFDPAVQHSVLWFDFTLPVGPYPSTWGHVYNEVIHVVALDSVQLTDGWHRSWVLGYVGNDGMVYDSVFCSVIEGIGSTFGLDPLNGLVYPFEWVDALDCHSVNGQALYPLGAAECDLTMGNEAAELPDTDPHIVPNPVQESFRLEGYPLDRPVVLTLYDRIGLEVITWPSMSANSLFHLSALLPGLYTLRIARDAHVISHIKLVIQ